MKTSQGELLIIDILNKENIKFIREYKFEDLWHGVLRYDFYLPDLNILIEFDGEQHFHKVNHFHQFIQDFHKNQEHDRRKNSYALARNIPLYRIPFWDFKNVSNFQDILKEQYLVKNRWHNDYIWRKKNNWFFYISV